VPDVWQAVAEQSTNLVDVVCVQILQHTNVFRGSNVPACHRLNHVAIQSGRTASTHHKYVWQFPPAASTLPAESQDISGPLAPANSEHFLPVRTSQPQTVPSSEEDSSTFGKSLAKHKSLIAALCPAEQINCDETGKPTTPGSYQRASAGKTALQRKDQSRRA
jgi:hypothetical protein